MGARATMRSSLCINSVAVAALLAGCSAAASEHAVPTPQIDHVTPPPTARPEGLGTPISVSGWAIEINAVEPFVSPNPLVQPRPAHVFWTVDVTAENQSSSGGGFFRFELEDDNGMVHERTVMQPRLPMFGAGSVPRGSRRRGFEGFELPIGAKPVAVIVQPTFPGEAAFITLPWATR